MTTTPSALVQGIRGKFPGAYDDMDDNALEQSVLKKHPEYQDMASPTAKAGGLTPGTFQTQPGGATHNVNKLGDEPLTYPSQSAAVSGAKARTQLPDYPQQLQESKDKTASYAPTAGGLTGGLVGGLFGAPNVGAGLGAAAGRLAEPSIRSESGAMQPPGWDDAKGAAGEGAATYVGGKIIEHAAPVIGRVIGKAPQIAKSATGKWLGKEAADAIFPQAAESLPGIPEGATTSHSGIGPPISAQPSAGPSVSTGPAVRIGEPPPEPLPGIPEGASTSHAPIGPPIQARPSAGPAVSTGPNVRIGEPPVQVDPLDQAIKEGKAAKIPTRMPPKPKPVDEVSQAVREGRASKVPTTMPPSPLQKAVKEGTASRIPTRMPKTGPEPLPGVPEGASTTHAPIGKPVGPPTGTGPTTSTGPDVQMSIGKPIAPAPEAPQGATGTGTGRRIILPGERIDPTRVRSAGSAAQATEQDLRRLADSGDIAAREELVRRRLPLGPTNYSNVPLPR